MKLDRLQEYASGEDASAGVYPTKEQDAAEQLAEWARLQGNADRFLLQRPALQRLLIGIREDAPITQ